MIILNTYVKTNRVEKGVHFMALYVSLGRNYPVLSVNKTYPLKWHNL